MRKLSLIPFLALVKAGVTAVAILMLALLSRRFLDYPRIAAVSVQALAFAISGTWLLLGGRRDRRAYLLGGTFLLGSTIFCMSPLGMARETFQALSLPLTFFMELRIEVFMPLFIWSFAKEFPAAPISFRASRRIDLARNACWTLAIALTLLYLPILMGSVGLLSDEAALYTWSDKAFSQVWVPLIILTVLPALAVLYWKFRRAAGSERRRGRIFLYALVFCMGLFLLTAFFDWIQPGELNPLAFYLPHLALALLPVATAYSVLVHQVLDVRLIARKALQHATARSTASVAIAAPFVLTCFYLYKERHRTLAELFSGADLLLLLGTILVGILSLRYRQRILDSIDRRFFREQYNARQILSRLVDQIRGVQKPKELANLVTHGLDRALHLEKVALLAAEPASGRLVDPKGRVRPLDTGSELARLVLGQPESIEVDLDSPSSPLHRLSETDRHWLVDGGVRLLTPAFSSDGSLIGLILLGSKKSELPFLGEDQQLLTAIGSSTGLALELLQLKERSFAPPIRPRQDLPDAHDEPRTDEIQFQGKTRECVSCGLVYPPETERCETCQIPLYESLVPYVLHRQFRFEKRIGTGGMAVVYRATDLRLARTVAIKTLPQVSPEAAMRLKKEAVTAATVSAPGLAAIYGIETWKGTPMLILEMLDGGTLADRLGEGHLPVAEALRTGRAVALALERLHSMGILHRDVKPSNIGYSQDGDPKLLDFGIAKIQTDPRADRPTTSSDLDKEMPEKTSAWIDATHTATSGQIAGTLTYLSPEALARERPDPRFDLWALAVVLYEAMSGENLFYGPSLQKVLEDIRQAKVPDIRSKVPDCPSEVAEFLQEALHKDISRRPQSGLEMHKRLKALSP